jgi:tetratricopeptide (TPR) repeat protein
MQQTGGWYFSNPQAVSFGFTEFQKKWGRRKLEDLWRLSSKQMVANWDEEDEVAQADSLGTDSTAVAKVTDPKKREYYMQDLPMTEEKMAASNALIEEAYFNIGYIYKDGLKDNAKSIEAFETLLAKFPEHEHKLQIYYQLYKNNEDLPNAERAEYYRQLIVRDFPESDYAKIIIDPNYNLVLQAQRNAASTLYQNTYNAYMNNQFYLVINNYNEAVEKYQESKLLSKFEFLKALSLGNVQNLDTLASSLEYLVATYPESEVKPLAMDILSRLRPDETGKMALQETAIVTYDSTGMPVEEPKAAPSIYTNNPASVHFFMALVDGSRTNINALKIRLSDFNTKYFITQQLKINSIVFMEDIQMITVGNFESADRALNYYQAVLGSDYVNTQIRDIEKSVFVISVDNYPIFYREKNIEDYYKFFNQIYLKKTTGK